MNDQELIEVLGHAPESTFEEREQACRILGLVVEGRPSDVMRWTVFRRDGYQCQDCGTEDGPFEADHIIPQSLGGETSYANLRTLCRRCNREKGDAIVHTKLGEGYFG